jgi:hypothetical protein
VGFAPTPYAVWRVAYDAPYVHAVCSNAGVCIFETTQVGVAEPKQSEGEQTGKGASVVRGALFLQETPSPKPQA